MNSKEKTLKIILLCATAILAVLLISAGCTGQAGNTQENSIASTTIPETAMTPEAETGGIYSIDISEVIKIDLITMEQDVQNDNPLAYDYEVMQTDYLGKNDEGDYEFAGTIQGLTKTNYIGVMISEPDEESESGFEKRLYSGMKYEVFSGDENVESWNFSFTIPAEEIPEGTKFIMTGYQLHPI